MPKMEEYRQHRHGPLWVKACGPVWVKIIGDAVVVQDVATVPQVLDDGGGFGGHRTILQVVIPQTISSLLT